MKTKEQEQVHGGCSFCQKTVPVFEENGHYVLDYHDNHAGQQCEGSQGIPEGVTR